MQYKFIIELDTSSLFDCVCEYVYKNYDTLNFKQSIILNKTKIFTTDIFRNENNIKYKIYFGTYNFIFNNIHMTFDYNREGDFEGCHHSVKYYSRIIIGCDIEDNIKKFIRSIVEESNKSLFDNKINIYVPEPCGEWIRYQEIPKRKLSSIYIDDKSKHKIIDDIRKFLDSEDEYNNFGIPYKRSYLFSGIPGSGKTSFVKAICNEIGYNLSILSLNKKFDNGGFMFAMSTIKEKSILLLEDIDCLFNKRESSDNNPCITFSNFLNVLDGVLYKHGCIIFLTTNHPEKLDHALLRVGRIDHFLEFNYPKKKEIQRLFNDIIKDNDDVFNKFYDFIKGKDIPMSAIVHFLFINKDNWGKNIDELLNTNDFFNKVLRKEEKNLYT